MAEIISILLNRMPSLTIPNISNKPGILEFIENIRALGEKYEKEYLPFLDCLNLRLVCSSLNKQINNMKFMCFNVNNLDYALYQHIYTHRGKTLFYMNSIGCLRYLELFGYVYDGSVEMINGTVSHNMYSSYFYVISARFGNAPGIIHDCTTPFHIAFYSGKKNLTKVFLKVGKKYPEMFRDKDMTNCNIVDSMLNNRVYIKELLENNIIDIHHIYRSRNLLILAEDVETVEYLLEKGVDIYYIYNDYFPIAYTSNPDVFKLIISKMDLNRLYNGQSLLEYYKNIERFPCRMTSDIKNSFVEILRLTEAEQN